MLLQAGSDGRMHLVYCVSKKTTDAEKNYHSSRLELLAVVWSVDRLRQFLLNIKFTVYTDCQALVYLNAKKTINPQIARWYNLLAEFDLEIKQRGGDLMQHVDALSRAPTEPPDDTLEPMYERLNVLTTMSEEDQILFIQRSDDRLSTIIDILKKTPNQRTREEKGRVEGYELDRGRLYRRLQVQGEERSLYVIPNSMRKSLVVKFHDLAGHFSVERTVTAIMRLYWFPRMRRYVRRHISGCSECLLGKVPGGKKPGELHPIPPPNRSFERIHADHLGPFIKSLRGNMHLLVIIDALTKFVRLYPMKSTSTSLVLRALNDFILANGLPRIVVTDRGTAFTAKGFESFCTERGIHHTLNSTRHPQANGQVERVNRTVLPVIMATMKEENDWDKRIKLVERDLNNAESKTTRKTPFECLYGYIPTYHDGKMKAVAEGNQEQWTPPPDIQAEARDNIQLEQGRYKRRYDKRRYRGLELQVGDLVVMRKGAEATGQPTKTQARYRGPLVVIEVLPSDTYRVNDIADTHTGKRFNTTAHISQLKVYRNPAEDESTEDESGSDEEVAEPENEDTVDHEEVAEPENEDHEDGNTGSNSPELQPTVRENRRPRRKIQKPLYLRDYIQDDE